MSEPIMLKSPLDFEKEEKAQESVELIVKKINKKKEQLIKERLKEKKMLHVLKDIGKRRFKKLMVEHDKDKEVVWVDNGTLKGLRLITFMKLNESQLEDTLFKTQVIYF